jgi:hypothetical protein
MIQLQPVIDAADGPNKKATKSATSSTVMNLFTRQRFNIICAIAVSLPTYSKIKPWQRATKVPQNASLIDAKCEPTPAGRNMLFHPSVVRNPVVPCCLRSAPAARQVQSGRFQRQKLGKTCLVLALKCWRGTATASRRGKMLN